MGDATSAAIPVSGGSFDATQVYITLTSGVTSYNLPSPNQTGGGTLSLAGDVYTLTLPLLSVYPVTVAGLTVLTAYSGQIVATAVVPEPGTFVLATIGATAIAVFARKFRRRAG